MTSTTRPRIGIVGGGPGGLMTAYFLESQVNRPIELTILEASNRLGGKIVTPRFSVASARYEAGAAEFYDYSVVDEDPLKHLIQDLGLSISPMGGQAVYWRGQFVANLDDCERVLGPAPRKTWEEFHERARNLISPVEFFEHGGEESLDMGRTGETLEYELQHITQAEIRQYLGTMIHSDLATEPSTTSVSYGLQNYLMNDPAYMQLYGIDGGNEQLPQSLAARIAAQIRLGLSVHSIRCHPTGSWLVETLNSDDQTTTHSFDSVIIALPLDALQRLRFEGNQLAAAIQSHLDHYNHPAHYLRITIAFERPFWRGILAESYCQLETFGGCCLYDESSRWPDSQCGILGWLLSGEAASKHASLDDNELIQLALDSLPSPLKAGRQWFLEGRVHRWLNAVNAVPGGWQTRPLDLRHQPEPLQHPRLFIVGDYLFDSTLNGVLDSADYVADWLAAEINATPNWPREGEKA
ncbi:MAG: NAD(P)/FAD-dependent oxidoreductase [Pirellulales bacterium]